MGGVGNGVGLLVGWVDGCVVNKRREVFVRSEQRVSGKGH